MKNSFLTSLFETLISKLSWSFVAYKFYYWFITSIFEDTPKLSYVDVIGIILTFYAFMPKSFIINKVDSKDEEITFRKSLILYPWVILFIGYLIYSLF